ncbi:related to mitochondrial cytosolically directed NADH dehydrogenase [Rhynchosporium agropyri]|uniref:Related to mitochondrial cytosolically directed NADH dehydrogenase n=1 Tax=Rhynchosporium agropyri TaxID=914238 RepID=A0A1E1L4I6_9HELO|nr:related to mitochondrial cytosolically directed NADH dehydrogenase [Rhynchosporium agropyri]
MTVTTRSQASTPSKSFQSAMSTKGHQNQQSGKPVLAILGTGWAGFTLLKQLSTSSLLQTHDIIVLSPSRTMALTPLLASAACGIFDFRIAEEPVRRIGMMNAATNHGSDGIKKYQVWVDSVDFSSRTLSCRPAVGSNGNERSEGTVHSKPRSKNSQDGDESDGTFDVHFDQLVIAPGSEVNTFDTPGVGEHCLFMKSVSDAITLREKVLDSFELASLPLYTESQKKSILHFIIVGGGPTGVELAAELDELIHGHLLSIYPECRDLVSVSVYDVADRMLGMFGEKLSEYAMEKFRRRDVNICMGRHIEGFEKGVMKVKEDGEVGFGVAVWAAGNKTSGLVEGMEGVKKDDAGKLVTDGYLRVIGEEGEAMNGVWAMGDAAGIDQNGLPATAEVAVQKAKWLAEHLTLQSSSSEKEGSSPRGKEFEYEQKALVAYIGRKDGVVDGGGKWTGKSAWLAWRGGNLQWTQSWRRKAMIMIYWVLNKWDGREIARR